MARERVESTTALRQAAAFDRRFGLSAFSGAPAQISRALLRKPVLTAGTVSGALKAQGRAESQVATREAAPSSGDLQVGRPQPRTGLSSLDSPQRRSETRPADACRTGRRQPGHGCARVVERTQRRARRQGTAAWRTEWAAAVEAEDAARVAGLRVSLDALGLSAGRPRDRDGNARRAVGAVRALAARSAPSDLPWSRPGTGSSGRMSATSARRRHSPDDPAQPAGRMILTEQSGDLRRRRPSDEHRLARDRRDGPGRSRRAARARTIVRRRTGSGSTASPTRSAERRCRAIWCAGRAAGRQVYNAGMSTLDQRHSAVVSLGMDRLLDTDRALIRGHADRPGLQPGVDRRGVPAHRGSPAGRPGESRWRRCSGRSTASGRTCRTT